MRYCPIQRNFRDSEYLCKLGKEYLKHCYASFVLFSRQNLQTFDISHAFLPLTVAKLSAFKNGPVFLAHPVLLLLSHKIFGRPNIGRKIPLAGRLMAVKIWQRV